MFQSHYHTLPYPKTKENKIEAKDKIEAQHIYSRKALLEITHKFICSKIAKSVGIIYRSRYLWLPAPFSLYYTLIYPYMSYFDLSGHPHTILTWTESIYLTKRGYPRDYYLSSEYPAHTASWFAKLKILDIFGISNFHVVKFMFCYHHHLLPFSFFLF